MVLTLHTLAHSEIGLVRKNNQDSGYASEHLLLVADGMGGAAAGDLASAVAVDTIREVDGPVDPDTKLAVLTHVIHRANDQIAHLVSADYTLEGMGTTVTGALFDGAQLGLAHIGDSRAYLFRNDRLERLTHDHSWVQSLVDDGKISEAEAAVHPHRSLLLRVLNGQPINDPDVTTVSLEAGDRVLLCSDGLSGLVADEAIASAAALPDLAAALARLVELALAAGGIDNITVLLSEVREASAGVPAVPGPGEALVLGAAADRDVPAALAAVQAGRHPYDLEAEDDEDVELPPTPSLEPDEARYLPQPPLRGRRWPRVGVLVAVLLVLAGGLGAGYAWTRTQFFVGDSAGQVAIYRGIPNALPGMHLAKVYEVADTPVADLPSYYQRMVHDGIDVADLATAHQTVRELNQQAQRCRQERSTPRPSAAPNHSSRSASPTPVRSSDAAPSAGSSTAITSSATSSGAPSSPQREACQ